VVDHNVF